MSWRPAKSLVALKREIDGRWPNRDRRTDGFIGDAAHCANGGTSDHCPNANDVVRAFDVDSDGIPASWVAEHIRRRGAQGDRRLANGGYVIFNRRIASWSHGWRWREYHGDSPHTDHIHISISQDASGYDAAGGWGVRGAAVPLTHIGGTSSDLPQHPLGKRTLKLQQPNMRGTDAAFVQRFVGAPDNGNYDLMTVARVKRYQGIVGLPRNGIVGPPTWQAMRVT
jgi:hypothetical protein